MNVIVGENFHLLIFLQITKENIMLLNYIIYLFTLCRSGIHSESYRQDSMTETVTKKNWHNREP